MAVLISPRILNPLNEYSDNLFNLDSTFDITSTYTVTSGSGAATNSTTNVFSGTKSLKAVNYDSVPMEFYSSLPPMATIETDGNYIISVRLKVNTVNGDDPSFVLHVYRNGVLYNKMSCLYMNDPHIGIWGCYAQTMDFEAGDTVMIKFEFNPAFVNDEIYVDGLKIELNDRGLGIPTNWSHPKDFCCSDTKGYVKRSQLGWASYVDTAHTVGAPQTITEGLTPVLLTNNGGVTINSQLPDGVVKLFDTATTKITPVQENDYNSVDVMFTVKNSVTNGFFTVYVNIPTLGIRFEQLFICPKTAGTAMGVNYSFHHFVSAQFAANGGEIYVVANSGNLQIYDKQYRFAKLINAK